MSFFIPQDSGDSSVLNNHHINIAYMTLIEPVFNNVYRPSGGTDAGDCRDSNPNQRIADAIPQADDLRLRRERHPMSSRNIKSKQDEQAEVHDSAGNVSRARDVERRLHKKQRQEVERAGPRGQKRHSRRNGDEMRDREEENSGIAAVHRRRGLPEKVICKIPSFFAMIAFDVDPFRRAAQYVMRQAEGIDHRCADDHHIRPQGGILAHPDPERKIAEELQKHGERAEDKRPQRSVFRHRCEKPRHLFIILYIGIIENTARCTENQYVAIHAKDMSDHRQNQNPAVFHIRYFSVLKNLK